MSNFDAAVEHVRVQEKGLVDNPSDPGGRTNFGITQRLLDDARTSYPLLALPATVDDLRWGQTRELYRLQFWAPLHGDELPLYVSLPLLDAAVNSSVPRAAKWLQLACGVKADGWIGMQTIRAARAAQPKALLNEFHARRAFHYMLQDDIDEVFGLGWARRLFETYSAAREVE